MHPEYIFGPAYERANSNPNGIWVIQSDQIIYANAVCLRVLGATTSDEVLGKSSREMILPEFRLGDWETLLGLTTTTFSEPREVQLYRLDGTIVDVELTRVLIPLSNGPAIMANIRDITARKAGQRRIQQLQNALLSGLLDAQEEERRTIAYDLHDGLTQYIAATNAHLEACHAAWEAGQHERARAQLEKAREYIGFAGIESRRLVNGLRCLSLEDLGLAGAVEQLLADERRRTSWKSAILSHNLSSERFEPRIETAAFRVIQEALNNARKHAQASHVQVTLLLTPDGDCLTLEIADDGLGLAQPAPNDGEIHVGMHGMRERVRLLDGSFEAQSLPEGGARIRASIPLKPEGVQTP